MDVKLFWLFVVLNIVNVILQTVKALATNKGGKWSAAISNAVSYGVYTILLVYMTCDLTLFTKAAIVAITNLIGVYIVKLFEEKMQKEHLWKIELTVNKEYKDALLQELKDAGIPRNATECHKWALFNCYCATKEESRKVREAARKYGAKFFVTETRKVL